MKEGNAKGSIRTVDTDVEVWTAFGTGRSFHFIAAHEIARVLGPDQCMALPMFHAFVGCDTVSFFGGKPTMTLHQHFQCSLATTPESVESFIYKPLERFVILLYDRSSNLECVNRARKQLFTQKGRSVKDIPPTKAALIRHTKPAMYQAGFCWGQVMIAAPELPSLSDWGWTRKEPSG